MVSTTTINKTTTIATTVFRRSMSSSSDDEGPFFDLDITAPDDEEEEEEEQSRDGEVEIEESTSTGKPQQQQQFLAGSFLKSATKFRVFTGLKKPKWVSTAAMDPAPTSSSTASTSSSPKQNQQQQLQQSGSGNKLFSVKLKVGEEVPIVSLFARDSSSRGSGRVEGEVGRGKASKEVVSKYLKKMKPLYVKASRISNSSDKSKVFLNYSAKEKDADKKVTMSHLQSRVDNGLRVVWKQLSKSKSGSSAVSAVSSPRAGTTVGVGRRRDDSAVQQHDGIQSAIAHCKRSLNASREVESTSPISTVSVDDDGKCNKNVREEE